MKKMDFYLVRAISNLHVGSGEGDFSVIDKQVQRDPVTNLPTIHASGIKGALRESMEYEARHPEDKDLLEDIVRVFGSDPKRQNGPIRQGLNNFFAGHLLALPIRSSREFFFIATCPMLLENLLADLRTFCPEEKDVIEELETLSSIPADSQPCYFFGRDLGPVQLEDWTASYDSTNFSKLMDGRFFSQRLALLSNDQFSTLARELPIVARNYLNDGISKNLWYEEIVPREARFYTMISRHEEVDALNSFLEQKKHLVQIGANATVGYGLCEFKKMEDHA